VGAGTAIAAATSAGLDHAAGLVGDLTPLIAVVTGIFVAGLVVSLLFRVFGRG